jgi:hypothetical protein
MVGRFSARARLGAALASLTDMRRDQICLALALNIFSMF